MKSILTLLFLTMFVNAVEAQLPKVSAGSIQRFENLPSRFVAARNVDVWLPEGYSPKKKYAVLYMHDGNSLFDSSIMWNHQEWGVDETVSKLLSEYKIKDVIVVGVWNSGASRHADYFPQKPYEALNEIQKEFVTKQLQEKGRTKGPFKPISDNYLKFLVQELKPFVDSTFSTKKDSKNTFIGGSSMGGLIAMYAICEYPNIFGGAICMSTHWPGIFSMNENPVPTALINYLKNNLPNPNSHKIYFDHGDQSLDALYPPLQKQADAIMVAKGYTSKNWITAFFPGENHSEAGWAKRLDIPLLFLLKK